MIGECYEKLRDSGALSESEANPKIEQAYIAVIEKYPDCSLVGHACLKLARAYEETDQLDLAIELYRIFLDSAKPTDKRIETIRAKLDKLEGQKE